jgi:hypothetical protein
MHLYRTILATLQQPQLLLLDVYPNASAAYSLRKLREAYTGNCIEVRRSSDNALQNIGFVNNELDTTSLLSFVGAGNGFISTWYDQSGSGRHATQTTNGSQPQIVAFGALLLINGNPSVLFNGVSHFLNITSFNFSSSNYNSFVGKRDASARRLFGLSGNEYTFTLWNDNKYYLQSRSTGYQISNTTDTTTNHLLLTGLNNGTNQIMYKNSNLIASNFVNFSLSTTINSIGRYRNNNSLVANCTIQEIVYYNSDQETNRTGIETNINNFYNIY